MTVYTNRIEKPSTFFEVLKIKYQWRKTGAQRKILEK